VIKNTIINILISGVIQFFVLLFAWIWVLDLQFELWKLAIYAMLYPVINFIHLVFTMQRPSYGYTTDSQLELMERHYKSKNDFKSEWIIRKARIELQQLIESRANNESNNP